MATDPPKEFYSISDAGAQHTYVGVRRAAQWAGFFLPHLRPGFSVLDCGCGVGSITLDLAEQVAPGQVVEFKGPTGGFVFNRADPRRPLFVAEEIGIVPIRSILWDLYQTGFGRPATLIYWGRDPSWLAYDGEFRLLARRYPPFEYLPVVREAVGGWQGEKGEAPDLVERTVGSVAGLIAYVSGGGQMINKVRQVLMAKGMERKAVKWEKFW